MAEKPRRRRKASQVQPKASSETEAPNVASAAAASAPTQDAKPPDPIEPDFERSADGRPKQFSIPPELVEHILFGPEDDRRVLQDSPLLGDVWTAYALDPGIVRDVLITPHRQATAAGVAKEIPKALKVHAVERAEPQVPQPAPRPQVRAKVAYLQGLIGAKLYFDEVLRVLVPRTQWWYEPKVKGRIADLKDAEKQRQLKELLGRGRKEAILPHIDKFDDFNSLQRYIALAGLIFWISKLERPVDPKDPSKPIEKLPTLNFDAAFQRYQPYRDEIIEGMFTLYAVVMSNPKALPPGDKGSEWNAEGEDQCSVFQISLNRTATPALGRSVPAVKADAANSLFQVNCKNIIWAVLDSGIQHDHEAFCIGGISRVKKIFDFTNIREIMSNDPEDVDAEGVTTLAATTGLSEEKVKENLRIIAEDFENERPTNWSVVEKLITVKNPPAQLPSPHGTHVAGIIGASKSTDGGGPGMCPDIGLYDFRVLGKNIDDTEFGVIAALQYIRYINERHSYITVHGANLSLSIPHNVRNFACGSTPVCIECERLVESGVVVVAAAGNRGYQKFETKDGLFENYAAFSITDPGNAESVITVGSTHSIWPNTYGVSFFSSRGPTGDGRVKPDLVAPGERITSSVTGNDWAPESGTSMAAPHVSGAAAMLLARYEELVGQPRRVKRILCDTATDLGRERTFQGRGMLDVLRAFQSI
jgi:hypothetical protein